MLYVIASLAALMVFLVLMHPFPVWRNFSCIFIGVLFTNKISLNNKIKLICHLLIDSLWFMLLTIPHLIDEIFFRSYKNYKLLPPVFIIGQPRSGTTYLHRVLSESERFASLSHYRWRYPFISVWWLFDKFYLTNIICRRNYWPSTKTGNLASKLHKHTLGDYEEHGIFLEERLFHHYFLFRRYPIPEIMDQISKFDHLSNKEMDILVHHMLQTVKKFCHYTKKDLPWLTKENECVYFYRALQRNIPSARMIFLARESSKSIPSYNNLSITSTLAKTGINPTTIDKWTEMNMAFRAYEYKSMIKYQHEQNLYGAYSLTYKVLTNDIATTIHDIDNHFSFVFDKEYYDYLEKLQNTQNIRDSGYNNSLVDYSGFKFFDNFVSEIESKHVKIGR